MSKVCIDCHVRILVFNPLFLLTQSKIPKTPKITIFSFSNFCVARTTPTFLIRGQKVCMDGKPEQVRAENEFLLCTSQIAKGILLSLKIFRKIS